MIYSQKRQKQLACQNLANKFHLEKNASLPDSVFSKKAAHRLKQ
jgi:hypothetical protein